MGALLGRSMDPVRLKCCVSRAGGIKSSQGAERGVEKRGFLPLKALDSFKQSRGNNGLVAEAQVRAGAHRRASQGLGNAAVRPDQGGAGCAMQLYLPWARPAPSTLGPWFLDWGLRSPGHL